MKRVFAFFAICFILSSCAHTKHIVTVSEKVTHDTISNTQVVHDSVFLSIEKETKHDTIYVKEREYKYKFIHDSIYVNRIDSIPVIKEVEVPTYERGFMWFSGLALWVIVAVIILGFVLGIVIKVAK